MPLNISYSIEETSWIGEGRKSDKPNFVSGVLPDLYDHYFKFFFPVGLIDEEDNRPRRTLYRELAELAQLQFEAGFSISSLYEKYGGLPSDFVVMKELDEEMISGLIEILTPYEECIFHGYGDDVVPEEFMNSWIIKGKVSDLPEVFAALNKDNYHDFNFFPNNIFATNKAWCIGSIIHQSGEILIGCFADVADRIRNQKTIEYIELDYNDEYFRWYRPK